MLTSVHRVLCRRAKLKYVGLSMKPTKVTSKPTDEWVWCDSQSSVSQVYQECQQLLQTASEVLTKANLALERSEKMQQQLSNQIMELHDKTLTPLTSNHISLRNSNRSWRSYMSNPYLPYVGSHLLGSLTPQVMTQHSSCQTDILTNTEAASQTEQISEAVSETDTDSDTIQ